MFIYTGAAAFFLMCSSHLVTSLSSPPSYQHAQQNVISLDQPFYDAITNFVVGVDATRVFHGRGHMYPGCEHLTLDYFPPVWLLTSYNKKIGDDELQRYGEALANKWEVSCSREGEELNWIYQYRSTSSETGLTKNVLMAGSIPDPHIIEERGNKFLVHLSKGQNHGIFLDMLEGRSWVQGMSKNKRVLNLFSYTCAFSVAAIKGGAREVLNIDMSKGALKVGQRNHELNNASSKARFLSHNIFKSWGKIKREGPYDIIIVDPPTNQKGSFVAEKDYIKICKRLPSLLEKNGFALLCLNATSLSTSFLREQVDEVAPELTYINRLENPESFPAEDDEKSLKVLLYQLKKDLS